MKQAAPTLDRRDIRNHGGRPRARRAARRRRRVGLLDVGPRPQPEPRQRPRDLPRRAQRRSLRAGRVVQLPLLGRRVPQRHLPGRLPDEPVLQRQVGLLPALRPAPVPRLREPQRELREPDGSGAAVRPEGRAPRRAAPGPRGHDFGRRQHLRPGGGGLRLRAEPDALHGRHGLLLRGRRRSDVRVRARHHVLRDGLQGRPRAHARFLRRPRLPL